MREKRKNGTELGRNLQQQLNIKKGVYRGYHINRCIARLYIFHSSFFSSPKRNATTISSFPSFPSFPSHFSPISFISIAFCKYYDVTIPYKGTFAAAALEQCIGTPPARSLPRRFALKWQRAVPRGTNTSPSTRRAAATRCDWLDLTTMTSHL